MQTGKQLIIPRHRSQLTTRREVLPVPDPAVQDAIADLRIAYPAGAKQDDEDVERGYQLFAKAIAPFEPDVQRHALDFLMFNSPNNPYMPTAQDAKELCDIIRKTWGNRVLRHFGLAPGGEGWAGKVFGTRWSYMDELDAPASNYEKQKRSYGDQNDHGPTPGEPGCYLSWPLVLKLLKEHLRRCDGKFREWHVNKLAEAPAEIWDRFPKEILSADELDVIEANRQRRAATEAAEKAEAGP